MASTNSSLVKQYKHAWEKHCLDTVQEIFHKDIIYQEHYNTIIRGIDELSNYWIENSKKQRKVKFIVLQKVDCGNFVTCHWEASFFDLKRKLDTSIEGIMLLEIEEKLIVRLTEFFEHKTRPCSQVERK